MEAKAFTTFIRDYSLFKSEWLSTNILTLHKALIKSVMIYAYSACEFVADTHLWKSQHSQNKVFHSTGKFPWHTQAWVAHPTMKLCMQQPEQRSYKIMKINGRRAEWTQFGLHPPLCKKIMKMQMLMASGKAKSDTENIRGLSLLVVKHMTVQVTRQLL
jgi:hypothetical protein